MKNARNHHSQDADCGSKPTIVDLSSYVLSFRRAFTEEDNPSIESVLDMVHQGLRTQLFPLLLAEELLYRKRHGQNPVISEYYARFPDFKSDVDAVWSKVTEFLSATIPEQEANDDHLLSNSPLLLTDTEPKRFGSYLVISKLGEGNFGSVYKATHEITNQVVAIKMLKPDWCSVDYAGKSMKEHFISEAETMLRFQHPNIVEVLFIDKLSLPPYFAQTLIDGPTLQQTLLSGRMPIATCLKIAIQIAEALAHIHSQERWHRDLKPANILIDKTGNAYITDFGLTLDDANRWKLPGTPAGTYPYMAPEQLRGDTHLLNAKCDLWALGVILYEMMTGKRPFNGNTHTQLCEEILERCPPSPRDFDSRIPKELSRLCMSCLAKEDVNRPDSAADVRDELAVILEKLEPSQAATPLSMAPNTTHTEQLQASEGEATKNACPLTGPATRTQYSSYRKLLTPWILGVTVLLAAITMLSIFLARLDDLSRFPDAQSDSHRSNNTRSDESTNPEKLLASFSVTVNGDDGIPLPLDNDLLPLRLGNQLRLKVQFSRPAFFHLLWIDDKGEPIELSSPEIDSNPGRVTSFNSPSDQDKTWDINGEGGNEMILLLISESQIPAPNSEDIKSALSQSAGRSIIPVAICYQASRHEETRLSPLGGDTRSVSSKPAKINNADEVLLNRLREQFDEIYAIRIPISRQIPNSPVGNTN